MDKTKPKYLTIVYEIHDIEESQPIMSAILNKFSNGDDDNGYSIVAASNDHEIQRLEIIENIADKNMDVEIQIVLDAINVMDIKL